MRDGGGRLGFLRDSLAILRDLGGDRVFVISDGPYADPFRVVRDGTTMGIVNAPAVAERAAIRENATSAI